ncbi:efflux RND transporter periplasmic adaptor subunit [Patescibacteria group bacterium]|nr:efflux RND transporter periplasmic adaptor subunit [Patescibacteria group bacterium]
MKIKKRYIFSALIILGLVVVGYLIFSKWGVVNVKEVKLLSVDVEKSVSASGSIKAEKQANLSFGTSATITKINVEEGGTAIKGQILATADAYSQAKTVDSAKQTLENAKKDLEIYIDTYNDNLDAAGGRQQYERQIAKLQNISNQAQNSLYSQQSTLTKYYIKSPIAGTITDVTKKVGENATTNETILSVADLNTLYFEAEVDQEDLGILKLNQKVKITLDAFAYKEFEGVISEIPKFVDTGTTNLLVKIKINQNDSNILYGMTGDANIEIENKKGITALDFDSIFVDENDNKKSYVYLLESGVIKKQYIELGLEGDRYTQVITKLDGKTLVVPEKTTIVLKEGQKAQIVK